MGDCGCSQQGSIARPCCDGCAASGSACGGKCGGSTGVSGAPRHFYRVQAGDTPMSIARRLTGVGARMTELVAANPQKARVGSTFASLYTGERLALPRGWGGGTLQGLGLRLQGLGSSQTDAQSAGQALIDYITANGCDCSAKLCQVGEDFQNAYNAGVNDGTFGGVRTATNPGPTLTVDGKYGSDTNLALAEVMGSAPAPCWSTGACKGQPCGGTPSGGGGGGGTTTLPPVVGGGGPTGAPPGAPNSQQSSGSSTGLIVAGIALAAAAGGAFYYMSKHPPHGHGLRSRSA